MKINRSIMDSASETLARFTTNLPFITQDIFTENNYAQDLRRVTTNARRVMGDLREHTIELVRGTEDEAEYMSRIETCEVYVKILERNVALLDAGQAINILDCTIALAAFYTQEKAIQSTIKVQAKVPDNHKKSAVTTP